MNEFPTQHDLSGPKRFPPRDWYNHCKNPTVEMMEDLADFRFTADELECIPVEEQVEFKIEALFLVFGGRILEGIKHRSERSLRDSSTSEKPLRVVLNKLLDM